MYLQTYLELVQYFEQLPTVVTALKGVTVGADELLLEEQVSQVQYPHLRVDTPEVRFLNDDFHQSTRFTFRVFILKNEPLQTQSDANQVLNDTLVIAQNVLNRIYSDAEGGLFDVILGEKEGDAVRAYSGDNIYGWFFAITIELFTSDCP
jgi:hypothetical protein